VLRVGQKVDLSKYAYKQYILAIDANDNLVYVSSTAWWYVDSDGSIVIDFSRFIEWQRKSGYVVVEEPLSTCDERDCYRDWLDCDKFILYPNFEIIELNEKSYTLKVRRKSDGVLFKIVNDIKWFYYMPELEHSMTYCEAIMLFIALLAKLGKLRREDQELLEKDPVALATKFGEILARPLFAYGIVTGLILVEKK